MELACNGDLGEWKRINSVTVMATWTSPRPSRTSDAQQIVF